MWSMFIAPSGCTASVPTYPPAWDQVCLGGFEYYLKRKRYLRNLIWSFILAYNILHAVYNLSFLTFFREIFPQFSRLWAGAFIVFPIPFSVGCHQTLSRKLLVKFLKIPCPLIAPQSHAKCRIDKSYPCILCLPDNLTDIFPVVLIQIAQIDIVYCL